MRNLWNRRSLCWAFALLLGAVVLAILLEPASSTPKPLTLPDGREVSIVKVSYGTRHRYAYGPFWVRGMAWALKKEWLQKLGAGEVTLQTETPSLVAWARWKNVSWQLQAAHHATIGEKEIAWFRGHQVAVGGSGPTESIVGLAFPNFPRRNDELTLRFYDHQSIRSNPVATFNLINPAQYNGAQWTANPLPHVSSNDGPRFTLREWRIDQPIPSQPPVSTLKFDRPGSPNPWTIANVRIRDSAGNQTERRIYEVALTPDGMLITFPAPLWSLERAFKLEVVFLPPPGSSVPVRMNSVPLPQEGGKLESALRPQAGPLVMEELIRPPSQPPMFMDAAFVRTVSATFRLLDPTLHLRVDTITDQDGRALKWERIPMQAYDQEMVRVEIAADTRTLDFSVHLLKPRTAEFLVPAPRRVPEID